MLKEEPADLKAEDEEQPKAYSNGSSYSDEKKEKEADGSGGTVDDDALDALCHNPIVHSPSPYAAQIDEAVRIYNLRKKTPLNLVQVPVEFRLGIEQHLELDENPFLDHFRVGKPEVSLRILA